MARSAETAEAIVVARTDEWEFSGWRSSQMRKPFERLSQDGQASSGGDFTLDAARKYLTVSWEGALHLVDHGWL